MDYLVGLMILAASSYFSYQLGRQDVKNTRNNPPRFRHRRRR